MNFVLRTADDCRRLWAAIQPAWRDADPPMEVRLGQYHDTRSAAQNARMWVMLDDVARQVVWHGQRLTADEWKDVFTASLKAQRAVPGLDGGFVVIGARTSKMKVAEMTALMDLMEAFGAERGVSFDREEQAA
jgi:hypothetical protein